MVRSVGTGRMAVMARLLEAGSFSQNAGGYVGNQKLVAQYTHKEIFEADEPNLLDEADMHVFGLKPMDDPLHLVFCNACKKPVKASHYAAHADVCRVLRNTRDHDLEPNYSTEHRKPPQRQRGKELSVYANKIAEVPKHEMSELVDAEGSTASETYMAGAGGLNSFSTAANAGDFPRHAISRSEEQNHNAAGHTCSGNLCSNNVRYPDIPAPLATKIYYSQRNNRLRSEISRMFQAAETKELKDPLTLEAIQPDVMQPEVSSQRSFPPGRSSDAYLMTARKGKPANIISNQPFVDEALRQEASFTLPRVTDISASSVRNSGTVLETAQHADGGAPCTDALAEKLY